MKANHGLSGKNLLKLVLPLGVHHGDLLTLADKLDALSDARNKAAHLRVRAKTLAEPETEEITIQEVIVLLEALDEALITCSTTF